MKTLKKDIQYIIPISLCCLSFFIVNIKEFLTISELSYWSSLIIKQPLRIISYSFIHLDFNHLLSNIFGIVVVRYCFLTLNLKNNYLFFFLIILLIPMQTIFLFIMDNYIFYNKNHLLVGFSGVLFGSYTFILFSSIFGKRSILNVFIGLKKNKDIKKLMIFLLSFGIIYSFLPKVSLFGHLAGVVSGIFIFLI